MVSNVHFNIITCSDDEGIFGGPISQQDLGKRGIQKELMLGMSNPFHNHFRILYSPFFTVIVSGNSLSRAPEI